MPKRDGDSSSKRSDKKDRGSRDDRKHRDRQGRDRDSASRHGKRPASSSSKSRIVDDDGDDEEIWVEKAQDSGEQPDSVTNIPSRAALSLTSRAYEKPGDPKLPDGVAAETSGKEKRDDWMLEASAAPGTSSSKLAPMRQSDNLTHGGTFRIGEIPTGIAKPSKHNTVEQFTDGYGEGDVGAKGTFGGDFFSSLGEQRQKKEPPKPKAATDRPKMSSRELNTGIYDERGARLDDTSAVMNAAAEQSARSRQDSGPPLPGSSGSSWRMMKLKRAYEAASDENRPIAEVGIERFGSTEAFEAAIEERKYLDSRGSQTGALSALQGRQHAHLRDKAAQSNNGAEDGLDEFGREKRRDDDESSRSSVQGRYIFNNPASTPSSRPPSRAGSFRRPGTSADDVTAQGSRAATPTAQQRAAADRATPKPSTPIPSVFTPPPMQSNAGPSSNRPSQLQQSTSSTDVATAHAEMQESRPALSQTELNKLQAKILRARLMGETPAEVATMEREYESEVARSRQGDAGQGYFDGHQVGSTEAGDQQTEVRVLPTLDGYGRLYDVGNSKGPAEEGSTLPGNRKRKKEKYFETRDTKTGEVIRYNADDDDLTLEELLRQEKFGGGSTDQKDMDYEVASRIVTDAKFEDDLEYMDDTAERLARKKQKTEQQKKMFAINDFAKTRKALESCQFCYQDTDTTTVPPQAAMVCLGTRTYLSLPQYEPLVEGHALIVPLQHHLSMLEADDDTWDEVKNYMKTLMQMHAADDRGVIFYETVLSFKGQRHTCIECVPVPWEIFEELPAYFREAILTSEAEWSQHKKLIDFSSRPGGFRRAMVSNLPYFMVQWDYKGEKGFGHVIEGAETATGAGDGYDFDEGAKGGGEFPRYFAAEIIGNVMELEPRKWRKPRRMDRKLNEERIKEFRKRYDAYDWTKMLAHSSEIVA